METIDSSLENIAWSTILFQVIESSWSLKIGPSRCITPKLEQSTGIDSQSSLSPHPTSSQMAPAQVQDSIQMH